MRTVRAIAHKLMTSACALALTALVAAAPADAGAAKTSWSKRSCVYSQGLIGVLAEFRRLTGAQPRCALVFVAAPDWKAWSDPYFLHHVDRDKNWARWARARKGRALVVSQGLIPTSERDGDWLRRGADGQFRGHAKRLARNLIRSGQAGAVIRLGWEANGTTFDWSLGTSAADLRDWRRLWRHTALAMKSVRGQRFRFDWCVNAAYRPIALRSFYPGDDVVDIVGVDAYDAGVRGSRGRWNTIYRRPLGVREVLRFAKAHRKPLSIPEWGVGTPGPMLTGGDDPAYVDGIARVVRTNRVSYQSYFYNHEWRDQLRRGGASLRSYRRHFGRHGDSIGSR